MKEKIRSFNVVQIISNILLLITVIGSLFIENDIVKGLYWFLVNISIIGNIWFLSTWTKRGLNIDKKKSNKIFNELDNITMSFIVFYVLIYLGVLFMQNISIDFRNNIYVIIGFYILTIIVEIVLYIAEEKAYNETKKVLKETIKSKSRQ